MEHILISSSARRTEACAALDNEPLFSGPRVLLFYFHQEAERKEQHAPNTSGRQLQPVILCAKCVA